MLHHLPTPFFSCRALWPAFCHAICLLDSQCDRSIISTYDIENRLRKQGNGMELALIGIVALLTAGVTLFSGFGLGTILMPVFALFFPVPLAIAATAVVHLANNIFKFGLMAKQADWPVVARFGVPAALA